MSAYIRIIYDKLDFLEFKQNILFFKQPQHKASVFNELSLDDFLKIRDFTRDVEEKINDGKVLGFEDYEKGLFEVWPPIRSYPASSTLIAKALMSAVNYNKLFQHNN